MQLRLRSTWLLVAGALASSPAFSQTRSGCTPPQQGAAGTTVVRCRHVTIEIENGADVTLARRDAQGEPRAAIVRSGAVYIEDRGSFQIRTPDAIASVRGTRWAVDVGGARSSVFVVAGAVEVERRLDHRAVRLGPGPGVDVEAEVNPLTVKRWAHPRVRALLARFGR